MSQLTVEKTSEAVMSDTVLETEKSKCPPVEETNCTPEVAAKCGGDKTPIFHDAFHTNIQVPAKLTLPKIEAKPENYTPMPYIFRLPPVTTPDNIVNQAAKAPPFYIQLDHTIAVIWALFNQGQYEKPLGINQMQWALAFLKTIKNSHGRIPRDVAFCIEVISNELIDQYSELMSDVCMERSSTAAPEVLSCSEQMEKSKTSGTSCNEENKEDQEPKPAKESNAKEIVVLQDIPFSFNYADMMTRSPMAADDQQSMRLKTVDGDEECKANMATFLQDWRKDQMKKILMELDRLHSIETYLGTTTGTFEPYLDDKDKEMSALLTERMKMKQGRPSK